MLACWQAASSTRRQEASAGGGSGGACLLAPGQHAAVGLRVELTRSRDRFEYPVAAPLQQWIGSVYDYPVLLITFGSGYCNSVRISVRIRTCDGIFLGMSMVVAATCVYLDKGIIAVFRQVDEYQPPFAMVHSMCKSYPSMVGLHTSVTVVMRIHD